MIEQRAAILLNSNKSLKQIWAYSITDGSEVLFIGAALLTDIFSFKQLLANPGFKPEKFYVLSIYNPHDEAWQAANAVSELVRQISKGKTPPLNLTQRYNRYMPVLCEQSGAVYQSASECAQSLKINQGRLSKHLNRLPGHKSIKGLTFRYAEFYDPSVGTTVKNF